MERSIFSSHFIFSRAALEDGNLTNEQFDNIRRHFMDLTKRMISSNFIIYLRTDPEICYARLKMRNRQEENSVSLEYLKTIHRLHEKLFINEQYLLPGIVIVLNGDDERDDVSKKFINFIQTFDYKRCSKCKLKKQLKLIFIGMEMGYKIIAKPVRVSIKHRPQTSDLRPQTHYKTQTHSTIKHRPTQL